MIVDEDGTFVARSSDVLDAEQYLGSTVVSDDQRRRQSVLEKYLDDALRRPQASNPLTLLAWSPAWEIPFVLNNPERRVGERGPLKQSIVS